MEYLILEQLMTLDVVKNTVVFARLMQLIYMTDSLPRP